MGELTETREAVAHEHGDRAARFALAAVAVALWFLLWRFAHTDLTVRTRAAQIVYFLAAFAVFLLAVRVVWRLGHGASRRTVWCVVALGIVLRLTLAPVRPVTTSDIYRYLWEGRVVHAGYNPFADAPDSSRLALLHDWIWTQVQYKHVPAAYPPVAQYVFALSDIIPADRIITLKLILALFDIGTVLLLPGLLVRLRRPPVWVLLYAWHPLIVGEVVARGHLDSIGIFLLVLSARLLLRTSGTARALSGAALAASMLTKGYALFVLPFFPLAARPKRVWFAAGLVAAGVLAYLPFASAGAGLWRGIGMYATRWYGYTAIYEVVDSVASRFLGDHALLARRVCGLAFAAWLVFLWLRRRKRDDELHGLDTCFLALAGFYLLSPVLYPWYLAWTVPFLCLRPRPTWLLFTGTVYLYYAHYFAGGRAEIPWVKVAEYGPPLALALGLLIARNHGPARRNPALVTITEGADHESDH
jgi:hypothetical protein